MKKILLFFFLCHSSVSSQILDLNNSFYNDLIRLKSINKENRIDNSLTILPLDISSLNEIEYINDYSKTVIKNKNSSVFLSVYPINYSVEYNTLTPYNRNNGNMIPNRGYQHLLSAGFFAKLGPLEISLKPEHHYSENLEFDGFWIGHYPEIWEKRYALWNVIDMPERFGNVRHNNIFLGQSSISLKYKNFSLSLSNENIWWGPGIRNSIMMSNHAGGFKHLSLKTNKPIKTRIGNFEWQFITGRLESSGFNPPRTDYEYAGRLLWIPKINQLAEQDDWRYLQGYILTYSPKFIKGMNIGFVRWTMMYSALIEGRYFWMKGNPTYFPIFSNLFRKNDKYVDYENETNQAAGIFFRWVWNESNSEIYAEYNYNDAKANLRDLLLDSEHSRAVTVGIRKKFNDNLVFSWEWTQLEQSASRILRDAGSWYVHYRVYDGYTNRGEVLGAGIGPGSNSQFFSLQQYTNLKKYGFGLEIIDNDNDFYYEAFASAQDQRRYWKDFNFHFFYEKKFNKLIIKSNIIFQRQLNYQWELDDYATPYYHPGRDLNNLHLNFKLSYLIY